jgi:hypothetical protein
MALFTRRFHLLPSHQEQARQDVITVWHQEIFHQHQIFAPIQAEWNQHCNIVSMTCG